MKLKYRLPIILSLLFCSSLPAATVYLSCYENLDKYVLATNLSLKNFNIIDTPDAQFDFCFSVRNSTQTVYSSNRANIGLGYGNYGSRSRSYGGAIGYDPFWDDYAIPQTYEQTYLSLQIKDSQGRSIWKQEKAVTRIKKIDFAARALINDIPLAITTQSSTTPSQETESLPNTPLDYQ